MSYNLAVFEPSIAPKNKAEFLEWFKQQTQWTEEHSYNDPIISSPSLQKWFSDMVKLFPALNGPYALSDNDDDPKLTDYSIGKNLVYCDFPNSCSEEAHDTMKKLAIKHALGFFDVNLEDGEILFPDKQFSKKPWWKFW